jgi:glycosyltransferase involved in cell wall biosynthesis
MGDPPLVSVIMPVTRDGRVFEEAIESIRRQTVDDWEVVCIQNRDGLDLERVIGGDRRIRHLKETVPGEAVTRNHGLRAVAGEFVAFLDDDDRWAPTKLERQLDQLREDPGLCGTHTDYEVIGEDGEVVAHLKNGPVTYDRLLTFSSGEFIPSFMFRTEHLRRIGGFDPTFAMSTDTDMLFRACYSGRVGYIPEVLVQYRWHSAQMTTKYVSGQLNTLRILEDHRRLAVVDGDWRRWRLSWLGTAKVRTNAAKTAYRKAVGARGSEGRGRMHLMTSLRFNPVVAPWTATREATGRLRSRAGRSPQAGEVVGP